MNKHLVVLGMAVLLLIVGLSGCEQVGIQSEENRFAGTWKTDSLYDTLTLRSEGTCKKFTYDGTWSIKDGKFTLIYTARTNPQTYIYEYSFSNNNNTLTLTNIDTGTPLVYTKQL